MARVVILGATSAVAAEAAAIHAERGDALHLVGRSQDKLDALAQRLHGAVLQTTRADFDDLHAAAGLIEQVLRDLGGADTALIAHGLLGDQLASERDVSEAERIMRT